MIKQVNDENIPWFSLKGLSCKCKVIDVYDVDTITIIVTMKGDRYKVKCRLIGIDGPEKRTKNLPEKKVALQATEWLSDLILGKVLWINCGKWGKYGGRMLGTIYTSEKDEISINQQIINKGFAYKYNGRKKRKFEDWYVPSSD